MLRALVWTAIIALIWVSCTDDRPGDLLSESDYETLLVEMRMLAEYRLKSNDSLRASHLADSIFDARGINPDRFYRSHAWYESDASRHARRLGRLADSLSALDTQLSTPKQ